MKTNLVTMFFEWSDSKYLFVCVRVNHNSKMTAIVGHRFNIIKWGKNEEFFFLKNCNLIESEISPESSTFQFLCRLEIQDGQHRRTNVTD